MTQGYKMTQILGLDLTNKDEAIVPVMGALYVKTPDALEILLRELREVGYSIDNLRESRDRRDRSVSIEKMEQSGWSLWFAKLDIRHGKCGSCDGLISTRGIQSHNHQCEICGAITYKKIVDGTIVRFAFLNDADNCHCTIAFKAHHWDDKEGYLYLHPWIDERGIGLRGGQARTYLDANASHWKLVNHGEHELIRIRYERTWNRNTATIEPYDISGHWFNHQIVNIWDEKEYREYDPKLPVRDTISIYESWH
jgi:hypothetical protein